ncbi:MAG TPA: hypothetical protein VLL25_13630, partial [Acidimicrobiales bacterium]|nr:hypothetical protein [Acidimicrobiales bacterium]
MATIGFVPHPHRPEAIDLASSTAAWLEANGHKVRVLADTSERWDCTREELSGSLDLAVSLGGD